ncbi:MAG: replication A 70 kDa DNA-binding subunit-like, partial [Trebouxia sp. A1-2]
LGSVKRKSDNSELSRRDVTLLDQSQKTVTMTLWGETAQDKGPLLEAQDCPVITVTACRVSDYNGVSVSAGQRSDIQINPDTPEAQALKQWYDFEGRTASTQHAGEGLANARGSSSGGGSQERVTLQQLVKSPADMPRPDAKPEYHNAICTVANIDPQQSMYYQACPDNNRKVVEQNGQWYCEYDGKTYPSMVRRYVTTLRCTDNMAELTLNAFNEQVEGLLGMSADDLAMLKEGNPEKQQQYQTLLKKVQWQDYVVRLQTRSREYEGQIRMRYTVQSMKPVEFITESRRMIEQLTKLRVKAEAA